MSEMAAKVRLVRCPKCENLLPEVTDYSVYQCGGCGAVLKAKGKGVDLDTISQKSEEERIENIVEEVSDSYERRMNGAEKKMVETSDCSESDVRSNVSSSSRTERRRILRDRAANNRSGYEDERIENIVEKVSDSYERRVNVTEKKMVEMSDGLESDVRSNVSSSSRTERRRILRDRAERWDSEADIIPDKKSNERGKNAMDFENPAIYNVRNEEKSEEMDGFRRAQRIDDDVMGYVKGGSSNPVSRSNYAHGNADYVGDDRAELLKKLDELTAQLSNSGNLNDKGKEKVPFDRRMAAQSGPYGPENPYSYPDESLEMNRQQFRRPSYHNQYTEPLPLMHRQQEMGVNGFYPPQYGSTHVQGYIDPSRSHMRRQGGPASYQVPPSHHAYMPGPYMDTMEPYPSNVNPHHPSCPCYQCLNKRQGGPPHVLIPTGYSGKYSDATSDRMFNHRDSSGSSFGMRDHNPNPRPSRYNNAQSHSRWPSDVNSEVDGFNRRRPARTHLPSGGGQYRRPIAGGAPFLTCYNCFELLLLPKKALSKNKNNKKKMRCGACSTVIVFVVSNNNLIMSMATDISTERAKNTTEMKNRQSTSSYTSEAEDDRKNLPGPIKHARSADVAMKDHKNHPPPAGTTLQDYFEVSDKFHLADRLREGNRSGRSGKEKLPLPEKITPRRNDSSATEIDISSNEYGNTGTTFGSSEGSNNIRGSQGESFFAGIRPSVILEQETPNVTVNGHLIQGRLIQKAEKLAGPINPGNYWYDFRAGFWGVIGGPCLGIIPPFIEEFNYPMPEHCAGGNTGVYINGRELNQKDLRLLVSRGLPTERDRSYIVELSGRVLDEETGEELEGLGKLAPTVEKVKHGFGMRAPNAVAAT